MQKNLIASALTILLPACAGSLTTGVSSGGSGVAQGDPTQRPQSGGDSIATATPIVPGSLVEGWVTTGKPRYYRIDLQAGKELKFDWYASIIRDEPGSGSANIDLAVLDENGGKLTSQRIGTGLFDDSGSFDTAAFSYRPDKSRSGYIHFNCDWCGASERVRYKFTAP